ncbi:hypothetical protein SeLEV6574_g03408 [Synchytrium endobioticum]|nr:hypothetical protein SeLEV6574_g03408 [Synchytrium endobioticum]
MLGDIKIRSLRTEPHPENSFRMASERRQSNVADDLEAILANLKSDLSHVGEQDFEGHCQKCNDVIKGAGFVCVSIRGSAYKYHKQCYTCHQCHNILPVGKSLFYNDGDLFCESCASDDLGVCAVCKTILSEGTYCTLGNHKFHPKCFTCRQCQTILHKQYIASDGGFLCVACYDNKYAPTCAKCCNKIRLADQDAHVSIVVHKDQTYHMNCFTCTKCNQKLPNLSGCTINNKLHCQTCLQEMQKTSNIKLRQSSPSTK